MRIRKFVLESHLKIKCLSKCAPLWLCPKKPSQAPCIQVLPDISWFKGSSNTDSSGSPVAEDVSSQHSSTMVAMGTCSSLSTTVTADNFCNFKGHILNLNNKRGSSHNTNAKATHINTYLSTMCTK